MLDYALAASGRPGAGEIAPYAVEDVDRVVGDDAVVALASQLELTTRMFAGLSDDQVAGLTYAPGKWTLKEVLGHLADDERISAYRALCIARADRRPQPSFDENAYLDTAGFESRRLEDLLSEYRAVRQASVALFCGLPASAWRRTGVVAGHTASVRGLAFHIAGHELHHLQQVRQRYLPLLV